MDYKVFSTYYQHALSGRVPDLLCKSNIAHPTLLPSLEENDKIILRCIDPYCGYKVYPGQAIYKQMLDIVERISEDDSIIGE